jgi:pentapeptide MXKDX repeat protein
MASMRSVAVSFRAAKTRKVATLARKLSPLYVTSWLEANLTFAAELRHIYRNEGDPMKRVIAKLLMACCLAVPLAVFAQSGDNMQQDTMKHDDMKQDQMKKDDAKKSAKTKKAKAKKDSMKKDDMKKDDSMKHDEMEKK